MAASTSNIKDKLTTIVGIVFAIAGSIAAAATQVSLPSWLTAAAGTALAISGGVMAFLTGKNPDGTTKTTDQIVAANTKS